MSVRAERPFRASSDRSGIVNFDAVRKVVLAHGWLSERPKAFQEAVLDRCLIKTVGKGALAFHVGDPPGGMHAVVSGSLAVEIAPGTRGPDILFIATPGTWTAATGAVTNRPRQIGFRALGDSTLLYLPLQAINQIIDDDRSTWRYFALAAHEILELMNVACADLRRRDPVSRLLGTLLTSIGCRLATPEDVSSLELDVTQNSLAHLSNLSRTTVGTLLKNLENAGHLERHYNKIRVRSPDALRSMLED